MCFVNAVLAIFKNLTTAKTNTQLQSWPLQDAGCVCKLKVIASVLLSIDVMTSGTSDKIMFKKKTVFWLEKRSEMASKVNILFSFNTSTHLVAFLPSVYLVSCVPVFCLSRTDESVSVDYEYFLRFSKLESRFQFCEKLWQFWFKLYLESLITIKI